MKQSFPYYYGAMLGGAIGDALGAPIEFRKWSQIEGIMGPQGVRHFIIPPGQKYAFVTDDTQLTMFTAEGLIRSATRAKRKEKERTLQGISITVFRAYLRWLYTQGLQTARWSKKDYDGWLVKVGRLHVYRDPGVTCLTSLGKGVMGTLEHPVNDSLGCGCVMRVMPVGLIEEEEQIFPIAMRLAAITHGHPISYLSAATFAMIIRGIINGKEIEEAVACACTRLKEEPGHEAVLWEIEKAVRLAHQMPRSREGIESLGAGFVSHEVLAMSIYAALSYPDNYYEAVCLAINHSGDSDSIGGITGSLLGASLGYEAIPQELRNGVELEKEILELTTDLITFYQEGQEWLDRYPAW